MERRPYFVFGDLLSCTVTGAAVAMAVTRVVGPAWNPWLAMAAGMVLGMVVALPISLMFVLPFGVIEVLLPGMLVGMLAGMWAGMQVPMAAPAGVDSAAGGALIGVGVMILVYAMNARLTRPTV